MRKDLEPVINDKKCKFILCYLKIIRHLKGYVTLQELSETTVFEGDYMNWVCINYGI